MVTVHSRSADAGLRVGRDDIAATDAQLLARYTGIAKLPCVVQSPLREGDDRPSFSLFERGGRVYWRDFGTGEHGSLVDLLMVLWRCGWREAMLRMAADFRRPGSVPSLVHLYHGAASRGGGGGSIEPVLRGWRGEDLEWWGRFGVGRRMLEACDVHPASMAYFGGRGPVPLDRMAYAYYEWKDGRESVKLYQPLSGERKWMSSHDRSVWDLWRQAHSWPDRSELIVTSSRKDAMCLWSDLRVPCMALQGEGYVPKPQVMGQVLSEFGRVWLWYDNDHKATGRNPGQEGAARLRGMWPSLGNVCIPDALGSKDPSDLHRDRGADAVRAVWASRG